MRKRAAQLVRGYRDTHVWHATGARQAPDWCAAAIVAWHHAGCPRLRRIPPAGESHLSSGSDAGAIVASGVDGALGLYPAADTACDPCV